MLRVERIVYSVLRTTIPPWLRSGCYRYILPTADAWLLMSYAADHWFVSVLATDRDTTTVLPQRAIIVILGRRGHGKAVWYGTSQGRPLLVYYSPGFPDASHVVTVDS